MLEKLRNQFGDGPVVIGSLTATILAVIAITQVIHGGYIVAACIIFSISRRIYRWIRGT